MSVRRNWTRKELLIAFSLYCKLPFGKLHSKNPEIIKYSSLINRTPSALAMKLVNIASLDPEITSTGRKGLTGASETDRKMWLEMQDNWEKFILESNTVFQEFSGDLTYESEEIKDNNEYYSDNKEVKSTVRIGQSFFRQAVLSAYNGRCCISGLSDTRLLIASHIVPWRIDENNRLNPSNGLLLSMLHDKAFDIGIITINQDLTVKVSEKSKIHNDIFFNETINAFEGRQISLPEKFQPQLDFLEYHRKNIFIT